MNCLFAAGQFAVEAFLLRVLVQLIVILLAAQVGGWFARRLGQPQVCGEIAAGLLLGPSGFGYLAPELSACVFPPDPLLGWVFQVLAELGLVFLMFLVGLKFDFGILRQLGATAASVSLIGVVLPFVLGLGLAQGLYTELAKDHDRWGFSLIMAIALSITAMPVLARIMIELRLTRTRVGVVALSAAALNDAIGWIVLAAITAAVAGQFNPFAIAQMFAAAGLFVGIVLFVVRPLAKRWIARWQQSDPSGLRHSELAWVLVFVFLAALATSAIGIFAIIGPFLLGAALSDEIEFAHAVRRRLEDFVTVFFLPIFFTLTGLRTHIDSLDSGAAWLWCTVVLLVAIVGKLVGCGLAARWGGQFDALEAVAVGLLMNTRGLMELIVINLGRELGVLPDSVYCMLVIMAVVTTFMTAPLLNRLITRRPSMLNANE